MNKVDDVIVDERNTRRLLRLACCLTFVGNRNSRHSIKTINLIYIILVYIFLFAVMIQGLVLAYLTDNVVEKVESIHFTLVIIIIIAYMRNQLYHRSSLNKAIVVMKYSYKTFNEDNEENRLLHTNIRDKAISSNRIFCILMSGSCLCYLLFSPMRQIFSSDVSRKLPIPLYVPFDTNSYLGFSIGLIWEAATLFYICGVSTSVHQTFRGIMGRLRAELKLLNKSIVTIEERALRKYPRQEKRKSNIYSDPVFRSIILICLRDDCIHHQMLLRYYSLTKNYLGNILLLFIFLSSIILAAVGFLITRPDSHMEDIIKFLVIVSAELFFVYQLCWEGEKVAEESELIFNNLFNTSWYKCDKNFKTSLDLMQCGTMKPIRLTTGVFNVQASLQTYNTVISTSFQYFNLLRNSKNS